MPNQALPAALAVFDAINSGDFSDLDEYVTADFIDHGSPFPLPPGPDGYRHVLVWVHQVLKISYTMDDLIQTDDRIVIRATAHGVGEANFHGPAAAGRPYTMSTLHIYRTEGDRLAEHWGVRDEVGAMVQLGKIPAPDPRALDLSAPQPKAMNASTGTSR